MTPNTQKQCPVCGQPFVRNEACSLECDEKLLSTICVEPGCDREVADGYVCCRQCLHGTSDLASEPAIALKKRKEAEAKGRER